MHRSATRWGIALLWAIGVCATLSPARADVTLHHLFSDNAVFQRRAIVPVWGWAADGEQVTVRFNGQEVSTTASGGKWRVDLQPMEAGGPLELTVQGANTVALKNILIGEVWICSGQSNMQWAVNQSETPDQVKAGSTNDMIRLFNVPRRATPEPQPDVEGAWAVCGPDTVGDFSAVGYAFGKNLQAALNVPIGLVGSNYGGTPAEAWTERSFFARHDAIKHYNDQPSTDQPHSPSGLYNAMIAPLVPYALQGAIWYQGESNAGRAWEYRTLFPAMIESWREVWHDPNMPFFFVQLAPFMAKSAEPTDTDWAVLREAQLHTAQTLPLSGMAVITDLGNEADIHPVPKGPVGDRLALAARAMVYQQDVMGSGPEYYRSEVHGGDVVLHFQHIGGGLVGQSGDLTGFTICGADHVFYNAAARIEGDTVVVSCPSVPEPVAVRYGWANYPLGNLWNKAGLPATPFRTDDFPVPTQPQ